MEVKNAMNNITYIIDIECFRNKKKEYIFKEVAIHNIKRHYTHLYHIRLPASLFKEGYNPSNSFVSKYVHGLELKNYASDISYSTLLQNIKDLDPHQNKLWAYKGGEIEKKLLDKLGFKSLNLEDLHCPRFSVSKE